MALAVNETSNVKYFCRICNKGFGCGRALGGHMRAHGLVDGHADLEVDDQESDGDDKYDGHTPPCSKRMYELRTNTNRSKSLSCSSFHKQGKCTYDAESLVSGSDNEVDAGPSSNKRRKSNMSKMGNSSLSTPSTEEEDLANCLMMLSNATVDPLEVEPEESCASASKDEEHRNPMNYVSPISYRVPIDKSKGVATKGMFECKACKKVFNSHQALGGHRASHKKVKGCFAAKLDDHHNIDDNVVDEEVNTQEEFLSSKTSSFRFDHGSNPSLLYTSKRKSKVHECSICHRIFSSGQALGGHKRCHWITSNSTDTSSIAKFHLFQEEMEQVHHRPKFNASEPLDLKLDLNFPAPTDDLARVQPDTINPFEVSTEFYLHYNQNNDENNNKSNNNNNNNVDNRNDVEDEANSKTKLAKLSDLKDKNMSQNSSQWLQVGIGSASESGKDP